MAHGCISTLYTTTNDRGGEVFGAKHQKTNHTKTSPHWSCMPRLTYIKAHQKCLPAVSTKRTRRCCLASGHDAAGWAVRELTKKLIEKDR